MKKAAWITFNRNQNTLAKIKFRAQGVKMQRTGNALKRVSSAVRVIYCGACRGPVIDSRQGRDKHSKKGPSCAAAMMAPREPQPKQKGGSTKT